MALTFVQYDDYKGSSGLTVANNTALNTTSANLIVVCVTYWDTTGTVSSIADTAGNTYVKAIAHKKVNTNYSAEIWYAEDITGNANNITTVTFDESCGYPWISVSEYSGASDSYSLDDTSSATTGGTTHEAGNTTASTADSVIVAAINMSLGKTITVGAGYTALDTRTSYDAGEYKILTSTGDVNASFTTSLTDAGVVVSAIFKATGEAPGGTNTQVNIGDVWKEVDSIQINIGDVWKDVSAVQVNIGDAWKDVF